MAERKQRSRQPQKRTSQQKKRASSNKKSYFNPKKTEFKQDSQGTSLFKRLYLTNVQRVSLAKWGLYVAVLILLLVIQDVIMSRLSIFGATTDLVVCAVVLITLMEGTDTGSVFVLFASTLFYLSGSSPGPYSVATLTILAIGACMFRQAYWHRNVTSILLCGWLAQMLYEIVTFVIALLRGLTHWGRLGPFLMTGLLSCIVMIPLYYLINAIGQIGGNTWKE